MKIGALDPFVVFVTSKLNLEDHSKSPEPCQRVPAQINCLILYILRMHFHQQPLDQHPKQGNMSQWATSHIHHLSVLPLLTR